MAAGCGLLIAALVALPLQDAAAQSCTPSGSTTDCEVPTGSFTQPSTISTTNLTVNGTSPNAGTLVLNLTNSQTNTTVDAGILSVSSAANLGGAGGGLTLTIGGSQTGGGSTFGNLLETTGFTWSGGSRPAGRAGT